MLQEEEPRPGASKRRRVRSVEGTRSPAAAIRRAVRVGRVPRYTMSRSASHGCRMGTWSAVRKRHFATNSRVQAAAYGAEAFPDSSDF